MTRRHFHGEPQGSRDSFYGSPPYNVESRRFLSTAFACFTNLCYLQQNIKLNRHMSTAKCNLAIITLLAKMRDIKEAFCMYKIKWLTADDNRSPPFGTVHPNGDLSLGKFMREALADRIQIGFADEVCKLIIKSSTNNVGICKIDRIPLKKLACQITALGLVLPVDFWFEYNERDEQWEGLSRYAAALNESQHPSDQ